MDNSTFADSVIAEYMNEEYYAVKLNSETTDTISFMGKKFINVPASKRRSSHQLAQALLSVECLILFWHLYLYGTELQNC